MSPASGPVTDPKMFPAATMDDQEAIMEGNAGERTVLGTVPFSSPDPSTDAIKMLPLEDGTSAHQAALDAEGRRALSTDYSTLDPKALKSLAEERDLGEIEGSGKGGNVTKADYVAALEADDVKDMKASDWKAEIAATPDVSALDALAERYDAQDSTYKTVEDAFEARYNEFNEGQ